MRLHPRTWASSVMLLLALLFHYTLAVERHYYIAAVNIDWDYTYHGQQRAGPTYRKVVYREYDAGFKHAKAHPAWSGLLGPTLRGQEGDVIVVTFRNMADQPCSIHPHGIAYGKQSEGSLYFDNTSLFEKEDDSVPPGGEHTYHWEVTPEVAPKEADPPCVTYTYLSHCDIVKDYNSGLIGTLLVCKKGSLDDSGEQIHFHQEYVLLFGVFDESKSWYSKGSAPAHKTIKYTINGYTNGSVPDLSVCAHTAVSWNLLGMSSESEVFSVHFNGQVLRQRGHSVSSVGIISGTATSASMTAVHPGRWLLSSHISKHLEAGMHGYLTIQMCEGFIPPKRKLTIQQRRDSQEWTYYIAAEEIIWDYAPKGDHIDGDFKSKYLKQGPDRIGKTYRKAVFTQYTDASFTERAEDKQRKKEVGILGPVIRAQIRDVIKIVFKNKAKRPYSIYPHGLTIDKTAEGANYPEGGNQTHAVQPGQTHTYLWNVIEEDEPMPSDSRCLTRMYHSAVNTPRDIASGLVGPLLICKSQSLNKRNVQLKADKEQQAMFAIFDENKSWYLDHNINQYCSDPPRVRKEDPDFYKSNVMHTINGYVYESGQVLGFCNGEIVTWHVSSVGEQDHIQTATFYGHTFEMNNREEDLLSLFPMTGETITMNMDNIGVWLLASLNSHETTKGMRVKFKDLECFRDYVMEYNDDYGEELDTVSVWKPETIVEVKKEEDKHEEKKMKKVVGDKMTDYYADLLNLRTFKNKSEDLLNQWEQLDLSILDFDGDISPDGNTAGNQTLAFSGEMENGTHPEPGSSNQTNTLLAERSVIHGNNQTTKPYLNESLVPLPSVTELLDSSPAENLNDSLVNKTESVSIHSNGSSVSSTMQSNFTSEGGYNMSQIATDTTPSLSNGTSEVYGDNGAANQRNLSAAYTPNSTGEVSEDVGKPDQDQLFIYTVPLPPNSITTETEVNRGEDFVLLGGEGLMEIISDEYIVEVDSVIQEAQSLYSISPTTSMINGDNTTSSVNETDLTENIKSEMIQEFNTSQVEGFNEMYSDLETESTGYTFKLNRSLEISKTTEQGNDTSTPGLSLGTEDAGNGMQLSSLSSSSEDIENGVTRPPGYVHWNSSESGSEGMENASSSNSTFNMSSSSESMENASSSNSTFNMSSSSESMENASSSNSTFNMSSSSESMKNASLSNSSSNLLSSLENMETASSSNSSSNLLSSLENMETASSSNSTSNLLSSLESMDNASLSNSTFNMLSSSESISSESVSNRSNTSLPQILEWDSSSEEVVSKVSQSSSSREQVVIYLKNNGSEVILTSSLDLQGEHWGYEGKHELVPMAIPDHMTKYIKTRQDTSIQDKTQAHPRKPKDGRKGKKKTKIVHKRTRPRKGHAMKTKKRKEYKAQPMNPGFSPRGFQPLAFSPSGTRPVSSVEDLQTRSIVIGVPRRDFNDYDLYTPNLSQDTDYVDKLDQNGEEYEYVEYKDPYRDVDIQHHELDDNGKYFLKMNGNNARTYFITAEEMEWDYAGYGHRRTDKTSSNKMPTQFTKVVFRKYLDSTFSTPDIRGEVDEHLGILGPIIKAEIDQSIMIFFWNRASRPYSLHANGVSYTKQMEGMSYADESPYWYKHDNEVQPNNTYTYLWKVNSKVGPQAGESDCRTWAYYSGVNPERDINSGLIGPLLVCRKGTLATVAVDTREFMLLFMTFDENKSWYYERNRELLERKNRRAAMDPQFKENIKFHSINGIIYSLKGLRMYTNQLVRWHVLNMGSPKDVHSIHFHGQTFLNKQTRDYRQGVYPLLPGGMATLEMLPSKPGLWLLESEVGLPQQRGMQTLFLVLDNECGHPLGLISGSVKDSQITASNSRGYWKPHLARLGNTGKYNAWSTDGKGEWLQVDFQRPVVISKVATQGAKQFLTAHFVLNFTISYSTDRRKWIFYKGDSYTFRKTFDGNHEAYEVKENTFFPPMIGRFVRLHPLHSYNTPTVRMELYGCELDGCSVPLGMQSGLIRDHQITASSTTSSWFSGPWQPWFARLDKQGAINAWQAKHNDMQQWIQLELDVVKKITGIITQGAKAIGTEMFVTEYVLEHSDDGRRWTKYTDNDDYEQKTFPGNSDNNGHVKNYIYPPIFSKFIRIIPKRWQSSITMRIELLGCDFE